MGSHRPFSRPQSCSGHCSVSWLPSSGENQSLRAVEAQAIYTKEEVVQDFVTFTPPCIDISAVLSGHMPSIETVQQVRS